uniref:HBS1-like protein n=1 Tax=Phallusia mammillata TaxID=59560 RepID=A0A6F9DEX6_9ASCI|nr:HBS1-like protein [Phallusia mammillata]
MSRHRTIRNAKSYEYDDEDDPFGQSYEEQYGVSPGTMAHYTYSRSRGNVQFSSYMPSEDPLDENVDEEDEAYISNSVHAHDDSLSKYDDLGQCIESIRDVVGDNYPDDIVKQAAVKFKCDVERSIDYLLNSNFSKNNSFDTGISSPEPPKEHLGQGAATTFSIPMPQRADRQRRRNANSKIENVKTTKPVTIIKTSGNIQERTFEKVESSPRQNVKTGFITPQNTLTIKSTNNKSSPKLNHKNTTQPSTSRASFNENTSKGTLGVETSQQSKKVLLTPTRKKNNESAPNTPGKASKNTVNFQEEYVKRQKDNKQQLSMVVIGHVDAGKSTMMGHLLFQKGMVSKRLIHKYEQESKKIGKASFAYAWVLDETGEERSRGVTMDIAHNRFETDNHIITLMDAPGHRDFIPNMITGASQADVAILVIGASTGEFEAGFGVGGQTREHALLIRSLGVGQLAVAVNKLDTVDWDKKRFDDIVMKLKQFLKQAGFKDSDVTYVPVSGLQGENLVSVAKQPSLTVWYKGPSLLQVVDKFLPPQRPVDFAFRFCVSDVFRGQGSGISLSGKIESGGISPNTKVMVMPAGEKGLIKSIESNQEMEKLEFGLAGEHVTLVLNGVDIMKISIGSVVCSIDNPIRAVTRLQARIVVFNTEVPITRGFPVEMHYKAVSEPAIIRRLLSQLHKSTGEVIAKKPKFILKGQNALVEVETTRGVCLEEYSILKELGRFTLRYGGSTIAACVVTKLLS